MPSGFYSFVLVVVLGCGACAPLVAQASVDDAALEAKDLEVLGAMQRSIARARDRVFPALVNVEPIIEDFEGGKKVKQRATGSGVIIDLEGHVITNYHVAGKAKFLYCTLADKQRIRAHTVGSDPQTDIAVIKLELEEFKGQLHTARLGVSADLEVGDLVMAMGSPMALARSVTLGVISNVERVMGVEEDMEIEDGQKTGMFNLWIQTDAAINPGNSGGPLVNMAGEVVGINTRGAMFANNLGFSVPIDMVRQVVEQIIEKGKVTRSWTGLKLQPLFAEMGKAAMGKDEKKGVMVADVVDSSPAERSGVRPGDIIRSVDGVETDADFIEEIPKILNDLANLELGKAVKVVIERDGKTDELTLITQALEDYLGEEAEVEEWGLTVRSITDHMRREHRLESTDGVLVTGIAAGKAWSKARPGVAVDDVLREINGSSVGTLALFQEVTAALIAEKRASMVVKFNRGLTRMVAVVKPSYEDEKTDGAAEESEPPVEDEAEENEGEKEDDSNE